MFGTLRGIAKRAAIAVVLHQRIMWRGSRRTGAVALTFDDGPDPVHTPALLDRLDHLGVTATFFVIGEKAIRHHELVAEIAKRGHEIGNHSYAHHPYDRRRSIDMGQEIESGNKAIERITGSAPATFRPPYGAVSLPVLRYCAANRMPIVLWSIDTRDFEAASPEDCFLRMSPVAGGDIVLMHDNNKIAQHIVEHEVPRLKDRGMSFVRVSDFL